MFTKENLLSDPFGSGSESDRFDRIRMRILQNVRILLDSDLDLDPQHYLKMRRILKLPYTFIAGLNRIEPQNERIERQVRLRIRKFSYEWLYRISYADW